MTDDGFKRGAVHDEDSGSDPERTSPELIPETGRDNIQMFWESIGMKPGDDWKKDADGGDTSKE